MSQAFDTYQDGVVSIAQVKRPRFPTWREIPVVGPIATSPYPKRAFFHDQSSLSVFSAVEFIDDGKVDGPEYHLSIAKQHRTRGTTRCTGNEARWVLKQFDLEGAIEDNHVPGGMVRNFWRPVAEPMVGRPCPCIEAENAIAEDKGDYIWRA